jgi:hypothetical protein
LENELKKYLVVLSLNGDASDVIDQFESEIDEKKSSKSDGSTIYKRYSLPEELSIIHLDAYNGMVLNESVNDDIFGKLKNAPIDFLVSKADNTIYFNDGNGFSKEYEGNIVLETNLSIPDILDYALERSSKVFDKKKVFFYGSDISDIPYGNGRNVVPLATTNGHFKSDMVNHVEKNGGDASNIGGTSGLNDVLARTMEMINFDMRPSHYNNSR